MPVVLEIIFETISLLIAAIALVVASGYDPLSRKNDAEAVPLIKKKLAMR